MYVITDPNLFQFSDKDATNSNTIYHCCVYDVQL